MKVDVFTIILKGLLLAKKVWAINQREESM